MSADGDRSPWEASVVLGDGDVAYIRPITPQDAPALDEFHRRQSSDSIYRRYFSPKPTLTQRELDHFTNVDMVDRAALVVELHDEFVAWASYERWAGRREAEAAFMVDDRHHGLGIATLLLEHLAAVARANGIERFTAEVLGDNRAMLAVFAKAGWPLQRRYESGIVDLDWEISATEEYLDSVERREQRADSRAVARILLPRSIAVIGASDAPGSIGRDLWDHVVHSVDVPVYPVNPNRSTVDGRACYASVADLPDGVSLAIVAVPADALGDTIDACIAKRMRGAVIVTITDGTSVDVPALVARARRNGLRLIGPASMGIASPRPETMLQAAIVEVGLPPGGVAISLQSGTLGGSVLRQAGDLQLGVSWFVSLGDKCDVSGNDLLQFWEDDANTRVIALYTEQFGNPRKFARIAPRVSRRRPIVAVRTGAAADGSLGGTLYREAGVIEVPTVGAMLDTARVLATQPVLRGPRVAVLSNSRSPATFARAALRAAGLEPVDGPQVLDFRADGARYRAAVSAALAAEDVDGVLVIHAPAVVADIEATADDIHAAATGSTKPVVAVSIGARDGPLRPGSPVPSFMFPEAAAAVLGRSYGYGCWLANDPGADAAPVRVVDPVAAQRILRETLGDDDHAVIGVTRRRALLSAYGIGMPRSLPASPADAVEQARVIGYPVAVKSVVRRAGRSARAGVALDLTSDEDVREAIDAMRDALGEDAGELVVQAMVEPGIEVRVRCEHDERLGVIVSVGIGGVQADVIDDRTSRLAPVSPATAATMLREARVGAAIEAAGYETSALVEVIVEAAQLAADHPEVSELDLNPVVVSDGAAWVVDATIRLERHAHDAGGIRKLD